MIGRGLRCSVGTGKTDCILLDFSGNILRFGAEFEDFYHNGIQSLDGGERLDKKVRKEPEEQEVKACPECGHTPFHGKCMSCGHEVQKASGIIQIAGVMHEIHIGKGKTGMSTASLWAQVCSYARKHSAPEKQKWRAKNLFKDIAGKEPPAGFNIQTAPDVEISREVAGKIRQINIAYANRRAAA
jgi:DNA-directed RNA polymerase subunit RPC12/RpoP